MIHKFSMGEINIVLDVYSGAVHVVDEIVYEMLDYYDVNSKEAAILQLKDRYSIKQLEEAYDEIRKLYKEGLLFSEDQYSFFLPS